jgi:hypothetical protein
MYLDSQYVSSTKKDNNDIKKEKYRMKNNGKKPGNFVKHKV